MMSRWGTRLHGRIPLGTSLRDVLSRRTVGMRGSCGIFHRIVRVCIFHGCIDIPRIAASARSAGGRNGHGLRVRIQGRSLIGLVAVRCRRKVV